MDYKLKITDGSHTIEATNPDDRMRGDVAKRLYAALEDEWAAFIAEVQTEMRRLGKRKSVTLKSRPIVVTIERG